MRIGLKAFSEDQPQNPSNKQDLLINGQPYEIGQSFPYS